MFIFVYVALELVVHIPSFLHYYILCKIIKSGCFKRIHCIVSK